VQSEQGGGEKTTSREKRRFGAGKNFDPTQEEDFGGRNANKGAALGRKRDEGFQEGLSEIWLFKTGGIIRSYRFTRRRPFHHQREEACLLWETGGSPQNPPKQKKYLWRVV